MVGDPAIELCLIQEAWRGGGWKYTLLECSLFLNFYSQLREFCFCFTYRAECESYVKGFPGARYKKFSTEDEAETFVSGSGSGYSTGPAPYVSIDTML